MGALPQLELTASRQFELSTWLRDRLDELSSQDIGAIPGPQAMAVRGIVPEVVFTKEAWPHTDPKWPDSVFYTMTVEGSMYEFGSLSHPNGLRAIPGRIFCVEPLELHWLRPDPVVSTGWVALQWVVSRSEAGTFERALASAVEKWNTMQHGLPQLG